MATDLPLASAQAALCIAITLVLAAIGYRLIFDPLGKYPGPFLARFTDGLAGWHAFKGDLYLVNYRHHLQYGPVVRNAPNRLVFNTAAALQDIYQNHRVTKPHIYSAGNFRGTPSVFTETDRTEHRRRRKATGQVLSERSMRAFEPTMSSQVDIFLRQLLHASRRQGGHHHHHHGVVDMSPRCQWLATDVIGLVAFGREFKTQTEATLRLIPDSYRMYDLRTYLCMNWPVLRALDPSVGWLFAKKRVVAFRKCLAGIVASRMAEPKEARHDLYSFVASEENIDQAQREGIQKSEIWGEAGVFVNAGGATTATTLCAVFFYLSRNPGVYAKLAAEVRGTFASGAEIRQGPRLARCRYLRAVIDESLRICPPTPCVLWREKDPKAPGPLVVDGHVIPEGTLVGVGMYSVMHNPEYFPEPFAFRPERWLEDASEQKGEDEDGTKTQSAIRRAFVPFSLGDRSCAGKALAYLEISLTIAKTLWCFDFEKASGEAGELGAGRVGAAPGRNRPDEYQMIDRFIADHEGPNLVFRTRGHYWEGLG
ncbi:cytochrome P450 [Xylariomycetidae sp. FL2044]|nr:cytochrome P450 [Xylariomycetidae sp. FL2044]